VHLKRIDHEGDGITEIGETSYLKKYVFVNPALPVEIYINDVLL
jgi:hypothetical protein